MGRLDYIAGFFLSARTGKSVGHRSSGMGAAGWCFQLRHGAEIFIWKIVAIFYRIAMPTAAPDGAPPRRLNYRKKHDAGISLVVWIPVSA